MSEGVQAALSFYGYPFLCGALFSSIQAVFEGSSLRQEWFSQ